jgi:hypothetical protein
LIAVVAASGSSFSQESGVPTKDVPKITFTWPYVGLFLQTKSHACRSIEVPSCVNWTYLLT